MKYMQTQRQKEKEQLERAMLRRKSAMPPPPHVLPKIKRKGGWRHRIRPW